MAKLILEFNKETEKEQYEDAVNGSEYRYKLDAIWDVCFRPAFKHGYKNQEINNLLEKLGDEGYRLVELLGELYNKEVNE